MALAERQAKQQKQRGSGARHGEASEGMRAASSGKMEEEERKRKMHVWCEQAHF